MQALLRQAAEPMLQALVQSCSRAASGAAGSQHAAVACTAGAARLFAAAADGGDASAGSFGGPTASGEDAPEQPSPHRFRQPYRPDIRRFVHPHSMPPQPQHDGGTLPPQQPDLVQQYLAAENASLGEQRQAALQQVISDFQRFQGDTGSSEVQVALLTMRITQLAEHMRQHRKDYSSRRGLEAALSQRRRLLQYLRRTEFGAYAHLIGRLGLRDTYAKLDRVTLQIQQRRIRGPSKPKKKRK